MNTETRHTPGPWEFATDNDELCLRPVGKLPIIKFRTCNTDLADGVANARLIAAAPDLLEAAKEAIETIRTFHGEVGWPIYLNNAPEMKRLQAAIAKAEGGRA